MSSKTTAPASPSRTAPFILGLLVGATLSAFVSFLAWNGGSGIVVASAASTTAQDRVQWSGKAISLVSETLLSPLSEGGTSKKVVAPIQESKPSSIVKPTSKSLIKEEVAGPSNLRKETKKDVIVTKEASSSVPNNSTGNSGLSFLIWLLH